MFFIENYSNYLPSGIYDLNSNTNPLCSRPFGDYAIERFSLDCRKGLVLVLVLVLLPLWLASVFTLVLVLRQSSENRSMRAHVLMIRRNPSS